VDVVEAGLEKFVEAVVGRVEELDESDANDLVDDWAAIVASRKTELGLCRRLAAMGVDPYDVPEDSNLEEMLDQDLGLPPLVVDDVLAATSPKMLKGDLEVAAKLVRRLPGHEAGEPHRPSIIVSAPAISPSHVGYQRAAALRRHLGLASNQRLEELGSVARDLFQTHNEQWLKPGTSGVEGAVGLNGRFDVVGRARGSRARRFLTARAIHHALFALRGSVQQRLVTKSRDWEQAASRAFAAECLAPAGLLKERLADESDWDSDFMEGLASDLDVSSMVIAHQIENHGLG
jgi:hypothetical protein